jgi:hypothetical protein
MKVGGKVTVPRSSRNGCRARVVQKGLDVAWKQSVTGPQTQHSSMDVTDAESVRNAATQLKDVTIDVLVNSAGILRQDRQSTNGLSAGVARSWRGYRARSESGDRGHRDALSIAPAAAGSRQRAIVLPLVCDRGDILDADLAALAPPDE